MRIKIELLALLILGVVLMSGCVSQQQFIGVLEKVPESTPVLDRCKYCLTTDDGKITCGTIDYAKPEELEKYVGKRVIIYGKRHEGPVLIKCPIVIDAERIELIK